MALSAWQVSSEGVGGVVEEFRERFWLKVMPFEQAHAQVGTVEESVHSRVGVPPAFDVSIPGSP